MKPQFVIFRFRSVTLLSLGAPLGFATALAFFMGACGPGLSGRTGAEGSAPSTAALEVSGTIAVSPTNSEEVIVVKDEDKEAVCAQTDCEPNYVYSIGETQPGESSSGDVAAEALGVGSEVSSLYARKILGVEKAWESTLGSENVIVAVIDTGVEIDHPDLKDNIYTNELEAAGTDSEDRDANGYAHDVHGWDFYEDKPLTKDENGHGTHCAGIIAASLNHMGVVGIAPKVKIMPLRFMGPDGRGDTRAAIRAIYYAINNGAKVISNSWGGPGGSALLGKAVAAARKKGILFVAAAGNDSSNNDYSPSYPANYPGVVSVASTDAQDALSGFSNYGAQSVVLAAPGSNIYSTYIGHTYKSLSGTSMATPQVAGALALGLSALKKDVTVNKVVKSLCDTSDRIHLDATICGRMNVGRFVTALAHF